MEGTFACVLFLLGIVGAEDGPMVTIPSGALQGVYRRSYGDRSYAAFEGIPFAQPPVGDLRFVEPQPAQKWEGTLLANKTYGCLSFMPISFLRNMRGSEDCLYMYVYVPRDYIDVNENLDVIVHIHGGGFMFGAPWYLAGPDYLMDQDIVYVSFNYRLAVLGFLSTEDEIVPGNNGLKDQVLALRWIRDNIKYFGGNSDSITLTGLSAGGASVHLHYLSPLSKGLFHRGLSQSGNALVPWALSKNPLEKSKAIGKYFNCTTDSTELMIECLRKVEADDLIDSIKILYVYKHAIPFALFGPVVEKGKKAFLPGHPYELLNNGKVYDVPWVTSNTKDEGIYPVGIFVFLRFLQDIDQRWDELLPYLLEYYSTVNKTDMPLLARKIRPFYFGNDSVGSNNIEDLIMMFSDRFFFTDTEKAIRLHSKAVEAPVYYYFFEYPLQQISLFPGVKGVAHGDDGRMFLKMLGSPWILQKDDKKMMKLFTEFIAKFARTNEASFTNVSWNPLVPGAEEIEYLDVASPEDVKMKSMKHIGSFQFWNSLPIWENDKLF